MPNTTDWLVGQHLVAATITPLVLGSGGVLTAAPTQNIVAIIDSITPDHRKDTEHIGPVNSGQKNMVATLSGTYLRLAVLLKGSVANQISRLAANYSYCWVSFRMGADTHSGYFIIQGWSGGVKNLGKNTEDLTLEPCSITGIAQYSIT